MISPKGQIQHPYIRPSKAPSFTASVRCPRVKVGSLPRPLPTQGTFTSHCAHDLDEAGTSLPFLPTEVTGVSWPEMPHLQPQGWAQDRFPLASWLGEPVRKFAMGWVA